LPAELGDLNLRKLDIDNNWFISMPTSIFRIKTLEKLNLLRLIYKEAIETLMEIAEAILGENCSEITLADYVSFLDL
jgi:hypothetical protein